MCNDDRVLMASPSGKPACVFPESLEALLDRGFVLIVTKEQGITSPETVQSGAIPQEIVLTSNAFAFDFYRQVSGADENVFFSPVSMHAAFSMLYEGADGNTAVQLRNAFGIEKDDPARHEAVSGMMGSLNRHDPHATLEVANSLWLADWFEPHEPYVDTIRNAYQAGVETVDFTDKSDDGAVGRINAWAGEKTHGKIPKVLDPQDTPSDTASAILNAVYFKGSWETQFPEDRTRESGFWTGNETVEAEFMNIKAEFEYAHADGVQVLRMPYKGDRLSMLVILPDERDGLGSLEEKLTPESVNEWRRTASSEEVSVSIPKFDVKTHYDLIEILKRLDVTDVFDPRLSDLSGMADGDLYVSKALHDAYVKINEEGTEAAAVTTGLDQDFISLYFFVADYPFLFLIQDDESGTILFLGKISDPS